MTVVLPKILLGVRAPIHQPIQRGFTCIGVFLYDPYLISVQYPVVGTRRTDQRLVMCSEDQLRVVRVRCRIPIQFDDFRKQARTDADIRLIK